MVWFLNRQSALQASWLLCHFRVSFGDCSDEQTLLSNGKKMDSDETKERCLNIIIEARTQQFGSTNI